MHNQEKRKRRPTFITAKNVKTLIIGYPMLMLMMIKCETWQSAHSPLAADFVNATAAASEDNQCDKRNDYRCDDNDCFSRYCAQVLETQKCSLLLEKRERIKFDFFF